MYRIPIIILGATLTLGAGPCGEILDSADEQTDADASVDCTEMACNNMLTVEVIRPDSQTFLAGAYRFEMQLPDETELMLECHLASPQEGFICAMGDLTLIGVQIDATGTAIHVTLLGAPETVTVTVEYSGAIIGERTMTPVYEELYPNGPECPPTCYQAEEAMAVQPW